MEILDQIPGLRDAMEREQAVRNQSFLGLGESICGIPIEPLTLRRLLLLEETGNVFVCGGVAAPADVGAFFLVMCKHPTGLKRWRLLRRVGGLDCRKAIEGIKAYLDESMQDKPAGAKGPNGSSYYSGAAALADLFGAQYGWTVSETLDTPVKVLFQLTKAITSRLNPHAILFNPSDKVKGRWLAEVNAANERN